MAAFTLPKSARLRSRVEYLATREEGESFADGPLAASFCRRQGGPTRSGVPGGNARVGLTVSSKVGRAVTRNRIKRRLREAWRQRTVTASVVRDVVRFLERLQRKPYLRFLPA